MNKQLSRTLKTISPQVSKLINGLERIYNSHARITIEKIDRPLLLTQGEVQEMSDFITLNPTGIKKELYISAYLALYGNNFMAIPGSRATDFKLTEQGMDVIDFLIKWGVRNLKAIVHLDLYQTFEYDPPDVKIHWFKIQVATPKDSKTVVQLVDDEIYRKNAFKMIQAIRQRTR